MAMNKSCVELRQNSSNPELEEVSEVSEHLREICSAEKDSS